MLCLSQCRWANYQGSHVYLHQVLGPDAMLGFEGDGKIPEYLNEARSYGFALHLGILLALQCTRRLLHPSKSSWGQQRCDKPRETSFG